MLIGIDASRAVLPQRTGTENYSLHLIRHLLALGGGHRYRLYFNNAPEPEFFPAGAELKVMPFPRLWTHLRLSWEMARQRPDLLFIPAHILPLVHPKRSVVTVHDLGYLHYPQSHRTLDRLYLDLSTRYNARAAGHLIAVSQATKRDLVERYGVQDEKITVIYSGRDESLHPLEDKGAIAAIKRRYGIEGDYILYLGTLHPRKNLVRLIEAYQIVRRSGREEKLVIAGKKGWLYEGIFRRVEELNLKGWVLFPGYVERESMAALFSGARLFVLPSLYEGFGLPILEAMSCGTPVVCAGVSALPEVAGDAALLVDPLDVEEMAEAMRRALEDESLRAGLREMGLRRARSFSWEKCARETLAVLERE
ncbi:MAG: glycosyltransferase family 4 protein [Anaerolineae bacterium]